MSGNNTYGFYKLGGSYHSVSDPDTPTTGVPLNRLIGLNDSSIAAGFYLDAKGKAHGYTYDIATNTFTQDRTESAVVRSQ